MAAMGLALPLFWGVAGHRQGCQAPDPKFPLGPRPTTLAQVAHCLLHEFPSLTTLCTLSPMPGFADWLAMRAARGRQGLDPTPLLLPGELRQLGAMAAKHLSTEGGWRSGLVVGGSQGMGQHS